MHGPAGEGGGGGGGKLFGRFGKNILQPPKQRINVHAWPALRKKKHVCMVQPKKKFLQIISLSSKRFCLVSEQKKRPRNRIFDFGGARNATRAKKCINKIDCNK